MSRLSTVHLLDLRARCESDSQWVDQPRRKCVELIDMLVEERAEFDRQAVAWRDAMDGARKRIEQLEQLLSGKEKICPGCRAGKSEPHAAGCPEILGFYPVREVTVPITRATDEAIIWCPECGAYAGYITDGGVFVAMPNCAHDVSVGRKSL